MRLNLLFLALVCLAACACEPVGAWTQSKLFIMPWRPPPTTDDALSRVVQEGYNLVWSDSDGLDAVARHGLTALLRDSLLDPQSLDYAEARAKLDALIDKVKDEPGLEGYWIKDEPSCRDFPGLGRLVAYLKQRDPRHFAFINLFPTYANQVQLGATIDEAEKQGLIVPGEYAGVNEYKPVILPYEEHLRQYIAIVRPELLSYDHYHFFKDGTDGLQYFLNLALVRQAAQSAHVPFLNIVQASNANKAWRTPNAQELRWLVFTTLAYGGRGVSYFLYWMPAKWGGLYQDGKASPLAKDAATINHELAKIGPEMMKLESRAVYQSDPLPIGGTVIPADCPVKPVDKGQYVIGLFSNEGKVDTFMIVNRDYKKASGAKLVFRDNVRALEEFNRGSGKWRTFAQVKPGQPVTVALSAGDGRLFRMVAK